MRVRCDGFINVDLNGKVEVNDKFSPFANLGNLFGARANFVNCRWKWNLEKAATRLTVSRSSSPSRCRSIWSSTRCIRAR